VGADGYITKPFSPRELIARIRNVLRVQPETVHQEVIQVGELEIDLASMTVRVAGNPVLTTVREFRCSNTSLAIADASSPATSCLMRVKEGRL